MIRDPSLVWVGFPFFFFFGGVICFTFLLVFAVGKGWFFTLVFGLEVRQVCFAFFFKHQIFEGLVPRRFGRKDIFLIFC